MPNIVRIIFGIIGLVLILYVALLGLGAFFDWINPGGSSGRVARLATGMFVGLGITIAVIAFRRFRGK